MLLLTRQSRSPPVGHLRRKFYDIAKDGNPSRLDGGRVVSNNIFKDAGYCFKTPRAIRTFGNAGCGYDSESDVPLSERDRQRVNAIQRIEREKGCPR